MKNNNEKIYKFTDDVKKLLTKQMDISEFIQENLANDKKYLSMIQKSIMCETNNIDAILFGLNNTTRRYIIYTLTLNYVAKLLESNYMIAIGDPYWKAKLDKAKLQ